MSLGKNAISEKDIEAVEFRRSLNGYNPDDVDDFIDVMRSDIEALRTEETLLYKRLESTKAELERLKKKYEVAGDLVSDSKKKADEIIRDAKSKAAHIIMRTSKQCNDVVYDMISQVEEQKNIYEATKKQALLFRRLLFEEYSQQIKRINALVEAAGGFEKEALSDDELNSLDTLMGDSATLDDYYDIGNYGDEIEKIKHIGANEATVKEPDKKGKTDNKGEGRNKKAVTSRNYGKSSAFNGENAYSTEDAEYNPEEDENSMFDAPVTVDNVFGGLGGADTYGLDELFDETVDENTGKGDGTDEDDYDESFDDEKNNPADKMNIMKALKRISSKNGWEAKKGSAITEKLKKIIKK